MTKDMQQQGLRPSMGRQAANMVRAIASRGKRLLFPHRDYVRRRGSYLPPHEMRFNGPDQQDDDFYLRSSIGEADRVIGTLGCGPSDVVVDIGCGQGRLAIGLVRKYDRLRYLGIDVAEKSIRWCRRHIEARSPTYRFHHIDLVNARYNPDGTPLAAGFRLPVDSDSADIVYMWGVVTNMEPEHMPVYAAEIARMLKPGGRFYLTANVEDGVPKVSINPDHYTSFSCHGPLHIVRYEKSHFVDVFRRHGLTLTRYDHHAAGNCQSDLYFVKTPS